MIGISRQGIGATTDTGSNLLVDVKVSAAKTTVGIGSTTFEISEFAIARPGHSFKVGDKFKPVGLVTAAHLSAPLQEFELEVTQIFSDKFSAWQFGELDFIDTIKNLQDGARKRFPLFFNGQLLSFEKDLTNNRSQLIDLNAVLLIFVNGVLQQLVKHISLKVALHLNLKKHQEQKQKLIFSSTKDNRELMLTLQTFNKQLKLVMN